MAEKEAKNINTALKGVLGTDSTLVGLVGGNVRQIETDVEGGLMTFDKGVSKSDFTEMVNNVEPIGKVELSNMQAVSGNNVAEVFNDIGVTIQKSNELINIAPELVSPDFLDNSVWRDGIFLANGDSATAAGWKSTRNYIEVFEGEFLSNLYFTGNAHMVIYDSNYNVVRTIGGKGHPKGELEWKETILQGESFARVSRRIAETFDSYIKQYTYNEEHTDKVFYLSKNIPALKNEILINVENEFNNYGFSKIEKGTNFLQDLTDSDYNDANVWVEDAFLQADGKVSINQVGFRYTKEYHLIDSGLKGQLIRFRNRFNGNAKCLIYNEQEQVIQVFENLTSTWMQDKEYVINNDAHFIRLSMRGDYTSSILFANVNDIYVSDVNVVVSDEVKIGNSDAVSSNAVASNIIEIEELKAVEKPNHPIVTFISDDGRTGNLTWFLPMMEENNCRATLAIVGDWLNGGKGYITMTRDEVRACYLKGHDIASHTNTHPRMTQITPEQLDQELYKSRFALAEIGIDAKMFVAPFGNRNTETDKVLRKYFDTDFITVNDATIASKTCTNLPIIDRFNLKRISFDASNNTDSRLEVCKQAVDVLVEKGGWLVFAIHPHYDEFLQSGNPDGYEARRQELQDLITYIKSKEINILPANLAYEYYKNQTQIGEIRLTDKRLIIGSNGEVLDNLFI